MFNIFSVFIIKIIVALIALLFCDQLLSFFIHKVKNKKMLNDLMLLLINAASMPMRFLNLFFWLVIIFYEMNQYYSLFLIVKYVDYIKSIVWSISFCWFLFRLNNNLNNFILIQHDKLIRMFNPALISFVYHIFKVLLLGVAVAIILYLLGVPLESLMMFQGAISIALGFAAQNVLVNGFGGLMILINQPFKVGDLISSPDKKIEGRVEEIRWDSTKIMNLDRRPFYVPNSIFNQIIIVNISKMYNRHILQFIHLKYENVDKVLEITKDIKEMLRSHKDIDQTQVIIAHLVDFGSQALKIEISAFTKSMKKELFYAIQQDVCIKIANIIKQHNAEIVILSNCS